MFLEKFGSPYCPKLPWLRRPFLIPQLDRVGVYHLFSNTHWAALGCRCVGQGDRRPVAALRRKKINSLFPVRGRWPNFARSSKFIFYFLKIFYPRDWRDISISIQRIASSLLWLFILGQEHFDPFRIYLAYIGQNIWQFDQIFDFFGQKNNFPK